MSSSSAHMQSKQPSHRGRWLLVIILIVLVVLAVFGILSRLHDQHTLKDRTDQNAIPTVSVAKPKAAPLSQDLSLPGSVASWQDAEIYARTTGYIAKWYVDIGTKVKQGQKLAELDTPDVDNELRQGQAELRTDIATMNFDKVTADRYTQLAEKGLVAHQTADQYVAQYKEQVATVQAAQSNVGTLESEENFKHIVAPFDGVITQRNADVGALIASGNTGTYLFVIADTSKLRVYIDVPETYAASVKIGMPATVQLNTYGAKPITGSVARTADAIDATTRTLRTEVDVDNNGDTLVPGVYATVKLGVSTQSETFTVPANVLLFRSEGLRIGVVKPDNHVQLVPVTLGRDFGSTVEVTSGLKDGDQLVLSPSDSLFEGQQVKIAKNNQEPKQTAGK